MANQPVLMSRSIVESAMSDPKFFIAMPEYRTLQPKMKSMRLESKGTCGGCKGRRIEQTIFGDFMLVLRALDTDALVRFKQYLKVGSVMYSVQDPKTGAFETRMI